MGWRRGLDRSKTARLGKARHRHQEVLSSFAEGFRVQPKDEGEKQGFRGKHRDGKRAGGERAGSGEQQREGEGDEAQKAGNNG